MRVCAFLLLLLPRRADFVELVFVLEIDSILVSLLRTRVHMAAYNIPKGFREVACFRLFANLYIESAVFRYFTTAFEMFVPNMYTMPSTTTPRSQAGSVQFSRTKISVIW